MAIKVPVFDMEKIKHTTVHAEYDLKYYVAFSEKDTTDMSLAAFKKHSRFKENTVKFCFREFYGMFSEIRQKVGKAPNRIRYICNSKKHSNNKLHLSKKEIQRWTELCKKHKLMPSNIGKKFIEDGTFDIEISNISKNMMYLYLSVARYIQDEPHFVRAVLHMVDDLKMGFFTSFAVASKFCITNTGHHIIIEGREYSLTVKKDLNTVANFEVEMLHVARLVKFVNGEDTGKKLKDSTFVDHYNLFNVLRKIDVGVNSFRVNKKDFTRRRLEAIIKKGDLTKPLIAKRK